MKNLLQRRCTSRATLRPDPAEHCWRRAPCRATGAGPYRSRPARHLVAVARSWPPRAAVRTSAKVGGRPMAGPQTAPHPRQALARRRRGEGRRGVHPSAVAEAEPRPRARGRRDGGAMTPQLAPEDHMADASSAGSSGFNLPPSSPLENKMSKKQHRSLIKKKSAVVTANVNKYMLAGGGRTRQAICSSTKAISSFPSSSARRN